MCVLIHCGRSFDEKYFSLFFVGKGNLFLPFERSKTKGENILKTKKRPTRGWRIHGLTDLYTKYRRKFSRGKGPKCNISRRRVSLSDRPLGCSASMALVVSFILFSVCV